jgi:aromatic ring-opening dioxygenase LigB subunit
MNAHGVEVERRLRRPVLSSLHAAFSAGGLAGAGIGVLVAGGGVDVRIHFAQMALLLAGATVAAARPLRTVSVSYGGNDAGSAVAPMDWGTLIPLCFLPELPVVVVSPARDRPLAEHVALGQAIAAAADGRVALVASADHGHAHDPDGPYGYDPAAAAYDQLVVELVRESRLGELDPLAELVEDAKADSLWQLAVLHGALGSGFDVELLSYEAPTYFGMLCAAYAPSAA